MMGSVPHLQLRKRASPDPGVQMVGSSGRWHLSGLMH